MKNKKVILVDLDGVLNTYNGNYEQNYIPQPKEGAREFLQELNKKYDVFIFTSRPLILTEAWLKSNKFEGLYKSITNSKLPAYLYIDDRAICHNGNFETTLKNIAECPVTLSLIICYGQFENLGFSDFN